MDSKPINLLPDFLDTNSDYLLCSSHSCSDSYKQNYPNATSKIIGIPRLDEFWIKKLADNEDKVSKSLNVYFITRGPHPSDLSQASFDEIMNGVMSVISELPDAFLRRCFFHYIQFPEAKVMKEIVEVHFPGVKKRLIDQALKTFFEIREMPGLKKKPSTSELLDWLKLLLAEEIPAEALKSDDPNSFIPPLYGALIKNEQDVQLLERLAFMARREAANNPQ